MLSDSFNYLQNKNKNITIDKMPLNLVHVGEILRFFPNAKFILALRHPYDCVLSCFMQNFMLNHAMANFLNLDDTLKLYDLTINWRAESVRNILSKTNKFEIYYGFSQIPLWKVLIMSTA